MWVIHLPLSNALLLIAQTEHLHRLGRQEQTRRTVKRQFLLKSRRIFPQNRTIINLRALQVQTRKTVQRHGQRRPGRLILNRRPRRRKDVLINRPTPRRDVRPQLVYLNWGHAIGFS